MAKILGHDIQKASQKSHSEDDMEEAEDEFTDDEGPADRF